jgi:beta-galactosidase
MARALLLALLVLTLPATPALAAGPGDPFPKGFLWGTATAGFQTEMGRGRDVDAETDWWAWSHDADNIEQGRVSGDKVEQGPGSYRLYRTDLRLARTKLHNNAVRLGVEWSRIFPGSTAGVKTGTTITAKDLRRLDRHASRRGLRHYRAVLREARRRHLKVFVTLSHFSLPIWIHDPIAVRDALAGRGPDEDLPPGLKRAGWLSEETVTEFRKYAAYLAWKLGDLVDVWTPLNEPMVVATNGFANIPGVVAGNFPPGAFSFTGAVATVLHEEQASTAAYDAVKRWDRRDADGDGTKARVGLVQNMIHFTSATGLPTDQPAVDHANWLFNRLFVEAAVRGDVDRNANGTIEPGERDAHGRKADFVGLNYYFRGRVVYLGAPLSTRIPILDFAPTFSYKPAWAQVGAPCPTTCTEFGWEIDPDGFRQVLGIAGSYGLPVYVTENGLADANDDERPAYTVRHLAAMRAAIADGVPVRGFFEWSLMDNFEWAAGYKPKFGLYSYDPATLRRTARPSAALYGRIARGNRIPADELAQHAAP